MRYVRQLFEALRDRRVLQIAVVYAGAAWVLAEASQFAVDNYTLSRSLLDVVVFLLIVGFAGALILAWHHGARGPQRPTRSEVLLLGIVTVVAVLGSYRIATTERSRESAADDVFVDLGDASVAVLPFDNEIQDPDMAWLGRGLAELLTTALAQLDALRVVSGQRLFDLLRQDNGQAAEEIPDDLAMRLSRRAGARFMVRGTVLGRRDDITLNASLINLATGQVEAAARARGADAFTVVDEVSSQLSTQILADSRSGVDEEMLTQELASVAEITTADIQAFQAYQQGLEAERRFRMVEAKGHYERAVLLDPGFALAHMRLASREMEEGNYSKALESLYQAHRNLTSASDRDRLLIDGLIAWRAQDDPETARQKFREIVRKYPDDKEGRSFLWQLSEGDEKLKLIEEAIRLDPFYGVAYNQLGYHLADEAGDFQAAHAAIDKYAELEPDEPNPHDSRGEIYEKAAEFESARESYRRALEIEPAFLPSLEHLTRSYLKQGKPEAARDELERYEAGPDPEGQAHVRTLTGDTYVFEGSFDEALSAYFEAAQIGVVAQRPELRIQALFAAAQLALALGRYDELEELTGVLYGIDPFNGETLGLAFAALGRQKRFDELDELREYVLRLVDEATAVRELGMGRWTADVLNAQTIYYRGDPSALVETTDRIRDDLGAPRDVFIWWEELDAHIELGHGERALGLVQNEWSRLNGASRYDVLDRLQALYEKGRAHELLGQPAEAAEAYEALVAQLGEAIEELPRLRDTPERLARLQASG